MNRVASKIGVTRGKEKLLREIPIETELNTTSQSFFVASYITIRVTSYRVYRNFQGWVELPKLKQKTRIGKIKVRDTGQSS